MSKKDEKEKEKERLKDEENAIRTAKVTNNRVKRAMPTRR